uniref:Reverse transcriptase Ty1/copia-type domain-containing protein n=2 Tax=Cajanus cajan TaxID=3821 RepID=A0A151RZ18_CAJCA|nr:hypothetical protein KK1_030509 [Cajanus cajan]
MKTYFTFQDLWDTIEEGFSTPEDTSSLTATQKKELKVFERKNRTVMKMARSMLKENGLPNTFWAEGVYTAVYILNRCPTKVVQDKTPIEHMKIMTEFKEDMMKTFEMTDLGLMNYFLGIEVSQKEKGIFICQKKYTEALLKKFKMSGCKTVTTPLVTKEKLQKDDGAPDADASRYRSLIGSLLYLTATRPDIMYAVSLLSRFMQKPSQIHFGAAKRILRYLQGTKEFGIWYKTMTNSSLLGYTDSDWAGSVDDMKSTSGYAFSLGSGIFSWASKKQATVAQSTAEAEYVAATEATSQAI